MATVGSDTAEPTAPLDADDSGLVKHTLHEVQALGESIGMVGPSVGAAALVPLAVAEAGGAAWLSVLVAVIGLAFVAAVIAELASRHVSMGALYTLIPKGLGPVGGLLAIGTYGLMALSAMTFTIIGFGLAFAQFLSSAFSIGHSGNAEVALISLLGLLLAMAVTLRGISLSTVVLLILEGISMTAIAVLLILILFKHGHIFDSTQLKLKGASAHGILIGVAFIVLEFGGFESATALGVETKNPRRAIPLVLFGCLLISGLFFVINAYIQTLGFNGTGLNITKQAVPLGTLASYYGVNWLGDVVLFGVSLSWFAVMCAWGNYAPRPTLAMADEGVLPRWLGRTQRSTGVPIAAVLFWATTWLVITLFIVIIDVNMSQAFANIGLLTGYAFTLLYLLAAIAGLGYSIRNGFWRPWFVIASILGGAVMVLVYWYSFNPLPAPPGDKWVYTFAIFIGVLLVGCLVAWLFARNWLEKMGRIEESDPSDA